MAKIHSLEMNECLWVFLLVDAQRVYMDDIFIDDKNYLIFCLSLREESCQLNPIMQYCNIVKVVKYIIKYVG